MTRAFAETSWVRAVMQSAYSNGGKPTMLMRRQRRRSTSPPSPALRSIASTSPQSEGTGDDCWRGGFLWFRTSATLAIVPNIFMRSRDAILLDLEMAAVGYLRSFRRDCPHEDRRRRKRVVAEYTLVVRNEAAHGAIADLT